MEEVDWLNDMKPLLHKVRVAIQTISSQPNKKLADEITLGSCWVIGMINEKIETVIEMLEKRERREKMEPVKIELLRIIEELGVTLNSIQPPGNESDYIEKAVKDLTIAVECIDRG